MYKQDNGTFFNKFSIGLAHSAYMNVLVSFIKNRNGRGALLALKATFTSKAIREKIIKDTENCLLNRKWTGTTDITLESHAYGH